MQSEVEGLVPIVSASYLGGARGWPGQSCEDQLVHSGPEGTSGGPGRQVEGRRVKKNPVITRLTVLAAVAVPVRRLMSCASRESLESATAMVFIEVLAGTFR